MALDEEVNFIDLQIDNAQSRFNTFIGGQWAWYQGEGRSGAVVATAGQSNVLDNINFSGPNPVGSAVGLTIRGFAHGLVSTPAFPASGVAVANATGRAISVQFYNMPARSTFCYQEAAAVCITQASAGGITSLPFRPGDTIKVLYASPGGAWAWTELD